MRMWMIHPAQLCNKHLLGEHGELHKFHHNFVKQHRINGRISPVVQIEPASMQFRHDELAVEMLRRGMNHKSPYSMPDLSYLGEKAFVKVDPKVSLADLSNRCSKCAERIEQIQQLPTRP